MDNLQSLGKRYSVVSSKMANRPSPKISNWCSAEEMTIANTAKTLGLTMSQVAAEARTQSEAA